MNIRKAIYMSRGFEISDTEIKLLYWRRTEWREKERGGGSQKDNGRSQRSIQLLVGVGTLESMTKERRFRGAWGDEGHPWGENSLWFPAISDKQHSAFFEHDCSDRFIYHTSNQQWSETTSPFVYVPVRKNILQITSSTFHRLRHADNGSSRTRI